MKLIDGYLDRHWRHLPQRRAFANAPIALRIVRVVFDVERHRERTVRKSRITIYYDAIAELDAVQGISIEYVRIFSPSPQVILAHSSLYGDKHMNGYLTSQTIYNAVRPDQDGRRKSFHSDVWKVEILWHIPGQTANG
jgi:hypothetical protein